MHDEIEVGARARLPDEEKTTEKKKETNIKI